MMMMVSNNAVCVCHIIIYCPFKIVSGVRFGSFVGPLFESSQMYNLTVFLNGEVSSPASVDVLDANGKPSKPFV